MDFLTPEQVASTCRVTTQTVLNWIHAGKLPAVRLSPRVIRVPREGFERFLSGDDAATKGRSSQEQLAAGAAGAPTPAFFAPAQSIGHLARDQGVVPVKDLNDLYGGAWPPNEDVDAFIAVIRASRGQDSPLARREPRRRATQP